MRATRILAVVIAVLFIGPAFVASPEGSGSTEVLADVCADLLDLIPSEQQRLPVSYYCQVVDGLDPIAQGNEPPTSSADTPGISTLVLDWLSSLGFLLPTRGV